MSSPAERYAAARRRTAHPALADFTSGLGFSLDPFQVEACEALDRGSGVLVCAPTGAGKTVVGEFAVHKALSEGRKAFYTTPIKALSNQKYNDLVERYGAERVGLLTRSAQRRARGNGLFDEIILVELCVGRLKVEVGSGDLERPAVLVTTRTTAAATTSTSGRVHCVRSVTTTRRGRITAPAGRRTTWRPPRASGAGRP